MPIVIIKKANAPVLPRADPLVVETHCDLTYLKPTREGFAEQGKKRKVSANESLKSKDAER